MAASIGITTCCYEADYHLVKATCSSVRKFLGDVELCVIVDGHLDASDLKSQYGAKLIYTREIEDKTFREICFQSYFAKFAAFFYSDIEKFLFLDSDAIIWGNPIRHLDLDEYDFAILNPLGLPCPREAIEKYQFNILEMEAFDPDFQYEDYHFFCSGAFAARQSAVTKEDLLEVLALKKRHPKLFSFYGDQPLLNYLVFSKAKAGRLTYQVVDRQFFPHQHKTDDMNERFGKSCYDVKLENATDEDLVLHFSGKKPHLFNKVYRAPFTHCRLEHYKNKYKSSFLAWSSLFIDDGRVFKKKAIAKLKRMAGN